MIDFSFGHLHGVLRAWNQRGLDLVLLVITFILIFAGTLIIYSASSPLGSRLYEDSGYFLQNHLLHLSIGVVVLWLGIKVPYHVYLKLVPILVLFGLLLLVLVLIPGVGHEAGGARRWLRFFGFSLQPVEVIKPIVVMYLAGYLARKPERVQDFYGILPTFTMVGFFTGLIVLQPDFGNVVLLVVVACLMLFAGGGRLYHVLVSVAICMAVLVWLLITQSYRLRRLAVFLDPWKDPLGAGFQILQSFYALGSGGLLGKGLGESHQKLRFLPDAHNDFILAIAGEELGLIGIIVLIGLFGCYAWRCFRISLHSEDPFGRLLAYGLTITISLQVLTNFLVVLGLLPTKGLPLPFISYGGSSLVFNLWTTGILLNIGKETIARTSRKSPLNWRAQA